DVSPGPAALLGDVTPLSTLAASLVLGASPIAAGGGDSSTDADGQEALTPGETLNAIMEVFRAWSKAASDMGDAGETMASVGRTGWSSVEGIVAVAQEAVGEGNADMLDLGLRDVVNDLADTLMEAGKAVISDLAN